LQQRCGGSTHPRPAPYSLSFHIKPLASKIPLQQKLAKYFDETSLAAALLLSLSFYIKPLASTIPLQQNLAKYFDEISLAAALLLSLFLYRIWKNTLMKLLGCKITSN
jgi:hypothetical protein